MPPFKQSFGDQKHYQKNKLRAGGKREEIKIT